MKQIISFDIGGTDIKYGIISSDYQIIEHDKMATHALQGGKSIIDKVIKKINEYKLKYTLSGVAISTAGIIDPFKGEVIGGTDTIPDYIGLNIKNMVESSTNLPCAVLNDVKCFALCEHELGSAKDTSNFIMMTIGTGIGGAYYLNNQLIYGKNFSAGEWGYMRINNENYENLASITALIRYANTYIKMDDWNGKKIFDLYDNNDPQAKYIVNLFYDNLATGIVNLIYIFNPEKIIIGGGISGRKEKFLQELTTYINAKLEPHFQLPEILLSKFSNQSGLLGAFIHFKNQQGNLL